MVEKHSNPNFISHNFDMSCNYESTFGNSVFQAALKQGGGQGLRAGTYRAVECRLIGRCGGAEASQNGRSCTAVGGQI